MLALSHPAETASAAHPALHANGAAPWQAGAGQAPANDPAARTDRAHYESLWNHPEDAQSLAASRAWLDARLVDASRVECALPDSIDGLAAWMESSTASVGARYQEYLAERKAGAPRRFFKNRSHALAFLRGVAPTKMVDGAWLYGVLRHWQNPRYADLVRTYIEELGDGRADRNHVLLFRQLLATHGLEHWQDLPDDHYTQGAIQLALAAHTDALLPEVIGFNLGYEQLPLHLPITAYELNELGIDPYYFTLHVTVDNADTGHALRAMQAVQAAMPRVGDPDAFWQRVRNGFRLNELGASTNSVIGGFDIQDEVERIFQRKSVAGHGAHSDYCRVAGRSVNDWLSEPSQIPGFLQALEQSGWIVRNAPPQESRFWRLLDGDHAEMFGVFSTYELQVIQDWLRGDASADGAALVPPSAAPVAPEGTTPLRRPRSFRAQQRLDSARNASAAAAPSPESMLDVDVDALQVQMAQAPDSQTLARLLVAEMAPSRHWMPAGLLATQRFVALAHV